MCRRKIQSRLFLVVTTRTSPRTVPHPCDVAALSLVEGSDLGQKEDVSAVSRPEKVENTRNVLVDSA